MRVLLLLVLLTSTVRADSMVFEGRKLMASLTGGVPGGLSLAGDYQPAERFTVGASLGGLALPLRGQNGLTVTLGTAQLDARARWHPFAGSFFLGLGLGGRSFYAKGEQSITVGATPVPTEVEVRVNNLTVTPHLGWTWVIGRGFSFGFELGAQLPLAPNTVLTATISNPLLNALLTVVKTTADYQTLEAQVQSYGNQLGRYVLPHVAVRLGWAFDLVDGHFQITEAPN